MVNSDLERSLLFNLAKRCTGKGVIVEIGSWKGDSTICLAKGSKAGKKVKIYAIDPHTGSSEHKKNSENIWTFEEFMKNIHNSNVEDIIIPLVKTSEEAAKDFNEPIELIFIDGAHEYKMVKLDFDLWYPKVIDGGIMAFHDSIVWPGPEKIVKEKIFFSKNFKNVNFVDSITYGEKTNLNTLKDRIKSKYIFLLKKLSKFISKLKLSPKIVFILSKILNLIKFSKFNFVN